MKAALHRSISQPFPIAPPENPLHSIATDEASIQPCATVLDVEFCVQAAARTEEDLRVLIETTSSGQFVPDFSISLSMFDVDRGKQQKITLSDEEEKLYPIQADTIQVGGEPTGQTSTLHFMNAQLVSGKVSISIPAVLISIPLSDQISIDLGSHPAAGQVLPVDKTIQISGMPVHLAGQN